MILRERVYQQETRSHFQIPAHIISLEPGLLPGFLHARAPHSSESLLGSRAHTSLARFQKHDSLTKEVNQAEGLFEGANEFRLDGALAVQARCQLQIK